MDKVFALYDYQNLLDASKILKIYLRYYLNIIKRFAIYANITIINF